MNYEIARRRRRRSCISPTKITRVATAGGHPLNSTSTLVRYPFPINPPWSTVIKATPCPTASRNTPSLQTSIRIPRHDLPILNDRILGRNVNSFYSSTNDWSAFYLFSIPSLFSALWNFSNFSFCSSSSYKNVRLRGKNKKFNSWKGKSCLNFEWKCDGGGAFGKSRKKQRYFTRTNLMLHYHRPSSSSSMASFKCAP